MNQSATVSFPAEYLALITPYIPEHSSLQDFTRISSTPLRKSIRVNTLKISVEEFKQLAEQLNWQLTPIPWCASGFWLERPTEQEKLALGSTAAHFAGLFYIQEASSMMPPEALSCGANLSGKLLLDMASAPGSKSTQLAAIMNNSGVLIANELSSSRIKVLNANIQRCGLTNTAMTHFNADVFGEWLPEIFDFVQLDAPCSGEGAIRKDPLAFKNWSLSSTNQIASLQKNLIKSAFLALKPGGEMIYSTCTLNPLENQQVCLWLQQQFPDAVEFINLKNLFNGAEKAVTEHGFLHVWPQIFDSEGFFVAKIRKTAAVPFEFKGKEQTNFPFTPATKKQFNLVEQYLDNQFGWQLPASHKLYVRDNEYWLFPQAFIPLIGKMRFQRIGVKLAELFKFGFKITHEAVMSFSDDFTKNLIEITDEQVSELYAGKDLKSSLNRNSGEMVAMYHSAPVALLKGLKGKLKNNLPRELIR
ncbi:16S rRNA (cytosine(1407)-C(5))-methyltransferase RsmF [Neptunicella marina]|nr:16S rRNA (cytosine(1407)-C(5))-methyltransferase RsmF [Neptunicella marina]